MVFGVISDFTGKEWLVAYLPKVVNFSIFQLKVVKCCFPINRHFYEMIICASLTLLLVKFEYLFEARVFGKAVLRTQGN